MSSVLPSSFPSPPLRPPPILRFLDYLFFFRKYLLLAIIFADLDFRMSVIFFSCSIILYFWGSHLCNSLSRYNIHLQFIKDHHYYPYVTLVVTKVINPSRRRKRYPSLSGNIRDDSAITDSNLKTVSRRRGKGENRSFSRSNYFRFFCLFRPCLFFSFFSFAIRNAEIPDAK